MQECSSSTKRARLADEFINLVFSWSLEDICNEGLYRKQVKEIPEEHQSVEIYLDSYVYPLLEETRAKLASAMDGIYNAPFAEGLSTLGTARWRADGEEKIGKWKRRVKKKNESRLMFGNW
ncbi:uncharacterized ATP-dependent helicase -like [Olea europaea subsp. europaea]|uniref:Uncharacterized ATP-dependent helicase -like n=1 Tax=Olea europaea subsp. europaea TaxID=158383 RepID=A0A8S0RLE8_OLEEU|nr:uncharacterized ATP-dependent helicase -like [Olea europaea subsp. europaea]